MLLAIPLLLLFNNSCRKDKFGNGTISFSTDTLTFDTVFTTLGSTTLYFKVFNRGSKGVSINDVRLMHLEGSQFRISVDGQQGDHFTNVEIPAKDSIYVFVEVTVNPNDQSQPFLILDDVNFTTGSTVQAVHLQAFGQNAHFHYGQTISANSTWSNDLPHVIISHGDVPGVLVDCNAKLTIEPGTKIFIAGNAGIFVEGELDALAPDWNDSIIFRGVRLESYYDEKPGQWFGLVFLRDQTCNGTPTGKFSHCVINEANYGLYAGAGLTSDFSTYTGTTNRPQVTIDNCIIKNSQSNAIFGFNADITANNSLFYVAGDNLVKFGLGGAYTFEHCTLFNNGSNYVDHQSPTLLLSNFVADGDGNLLAVQDLQSTFINSVVYGNQQNEVSFNAVSQAAFNPQFQYTLCKTKVDTFNMFATGSNNLFNQDPLFKDPASGDFTPWDSVGYYSPVIDVAPSGLPLDIFDRHRQYHDAAHMTTPFDLGAVEAIP